MCVPTERTAGEARSRADGMFYCFENKKWYTQRCTSRYCVHVRSFNGKGMYSKTQMISPQTNKSKYKKAKLLPTLAGGVVCVQSYPNTPRGAMRCLRFSDHIPTSI